MQRPRHAARLFVNRHAVIIGLDELGKGVVMVIMTVPKDVMEITANLQGPVILNPDKRKGKQVVLADPKYETRQRLFPEKKA